MDTSTKEPGTLEGATQRKEKTPQRAERAREKQWRARRAKRRQTAEARRAERSVESDEGFVPRTNTAEPALTDFYVTTFPFEDHNPLLLKCQYNHYFTEELASYLTNLLESNFFSSYYRIKGRYPCLLPTDDRKYIFNYVRMGLYMMLSNFNKSAISECLHVSTFIKPLPSEELEHYSAISNTLIMKEARLYILENWCSQMLPPVAFARAEYGFEMGVRGVVVVHRKWNLERWYSI